MSDKNEIGALLLRVMLGIVFLAHGASKFQGGIENIVGWFESIGLPGALAYVVATIELVGGIALILGIGTRIVSALIGLIMIGAIVTVQFAAGFLDGYAYDLVLLIMAVYLVLNGSKLLSIGQLIFRGQDNDDSFVKTA
ncbi:MULTISPECIES: DoxX family protein [Bacillaceae]|uniref:DoxX family protein n=1 Tax=Evansella alkalicola TaxID=745819 RepID=A0ABS6JXD3_9BACI|nr:DoxX family protein [Litchfieldia alkalitelluris]MBU9723251.1 DoxX family protein [Bacillus alkalicola]